MHLLVLARLVQCLFHTIWTPGTEGLSGLLFQISEAYTQDIEGLGLEAIPMVHKVGFMEEHPQVEMASNFEVESLPCL